MREKSGFGDVSEMSGACSLTLPALPPLFSLWENVNGCYLSLSPPLYLGVIVDPIARGNVRDEFFSSALCHDLFYDRSALLRLTNGASAHGSRNSFDVKAFARKLTRNQHV